MPLAIRPIDEDDVDALIELTLLAFEPIFDSFQRILGPAIFGIVYPDWRRTQTEWVATMRSRDQIAMWVAELDGTVVGLIAYELDEKERTGEVQFLVVHPAYQRRGVATALNAFALARMRQAGMVLAVVGTGGDASHAPARRAYEKAGYTALPLVRYYKRL
jgi:ribosomal protein S18 acetylase RimI-like enzyme